MHIGMSVIFQGLDDRSDVDVYRDELRLADLAEPLGFDSIWSVEHHFTEYDMIPDPVQFLTYMAGRTTQVQLGTMVVVLPWNNPVRVAEEITLLDILSGGRAILGIGRGLGRVEFEGFGVPMDEARTRFVESAELLLQALEKGNVKYEGRHFIQPDRQLRPAPFQSFRGRTYAAAVSPESYPIMAELGVGILIVPQKPWPAVQADLAGYREAYESVNGVAPPAPACAAWIFCDEDEGRARVLGEEYIGRYYQSVVRHYELDGTHFDTTRGYEYYKAWSSHVAQHGPDEGARYFTGLHVYGTPQQCRDKIADIHGTIGNEALLGVFSYAGMPPDEAERNLRLFAREVMPDLRAMGNNTFARLA